MATNQSQLHIPTPNAKGGLTYSKKVSTIKYHWIDIPSKDSDGGLSTPTVKGLNKKLWNTTMATNQSQLHIPTPNAKGGLTFR